MQKKGTIIVLEGMVGCGKTTQVKKVLDELSKKSIEHVYGREPGGVLVAEAIRHILLNPAHKGMEHLTTVLLFEAARAEYFAKVVIPHINKGVTIVTDRSYWSTIAFQGFGSGFERDKIDQYNADAVFGYHPDISFILDVENVEEAVRRAKHASGKVGEADRFEDEERDFHTRVRDGYRAILQLYPHANVHLIPHHEEEDEIKKRITKISNTLMERLGQFLDTDIAR